MTRLDGRTVAVTGAAGFLGGVIARDLSARGATVHALGRTAPDLGPGIRGHGWDPNRDPGEPLPGLEVEAVVDCAAVIPARARDDDDLLRVNDALADGARALAARSRGHLVYMSSQAAIGRPAAAVIDDTTPCAPEIPYGHAKLAGEEALQAAVVDGRLAGGVALRLPAVVGPGSHDNFPSTAAARITADEIVTVFNPDGLYNAVVDAATVADFIPCCLDMTGFRSFSLASNPPISILEAVRALADGLGRAPSIDIRASDQNSPTIDPSRAASMGFRVERPEVVLHRFGADLARLATTIASRETTR